MLRFWERFGIGEVSELPESEREREPALA